MNKYKQLAILSDLPSEEDYLNRITQMMKDIDKKIRNYPAGSIASIPFYFEKRRLLRIKKRIKREGIYN